MNKLIYSILVLGLLNSTICSAMDAAHIELINIEKEIADLDAQIEEKRNVLGIEEISSETGENAGDNTEDTLSDISFSSDDSNSNENAPAPQPQVMRHRKLSQSSQSATISRQIENQAQDAPNAPYFKCDCTPCEKGAIGGGSILIAIIAFILGNKSGRK